MALFWKKTAVMLGGFLLKRDIMISDTNLNDGEGKW